MDANIIDNAIKILFEKISILDLEKLSISSYNKRYLKNYIDNYYFFMPLYKQLLQKVLLKLNKPIKESVFVDYGGGCGILSFIALELGFKEVVYNDIYEVSVNDVKLISEAVKYPITHFVEGDIKEFVSYIETENIIIDICCSFDVLEHIYNLDVWFKEIRKIKSPFLLYFMTSANGNNPYKNYALKKIHAKAEYIGSEKAEGWKERDTNNSFLAIRKQIIATNFPDIENSKLDFLAAQTRGLYKPDIIEKIKKYQKTGVLDYKMKHKTNTCDPITGNWAEHIIDLKALKKNIESDRFHIKFTNSFYSYSSNKLFNVPKYIINKLIGVLGEENLFFSPTYTLEIDIKK